MHRVRSTLVLILLAGVLHPALAVRVRVTADRVNLRAAALETAEVVGQVSTGDELEALSDVGEAWVQVVPPSSVDLWVFAELVHDKAVIVSKAQIRAGAGLNFNVVGSLRRGAPVTERGRLGDWLKIAPPDGTSLWVSREFIEPLAVAETPASVPAAVPVPDAVPVPTSVPVAEVAAATPVPSVAAVPSLAPAASPAFPQTDPRYPEVPPEGTAPAAPATEPSVVLASPAPAPVIEPTTTPAPVPAPASTAPEVVLEPAPASPATAPSVPPAAPAIAPFVPPATPSRETAAGWENPGAGAAANGRPATAAEPVTPAAPPRSRVLLPQQPDAGKVVGPASIPKDRLSPNVAQGKPGRYEGQLSRAGALFYTPSDHRLVAINRAGKAVTVCYVLGNETQLGRLSGSRLAIEGPVYWFKSTQYPTILAERIQRLP
jgi:hypothetical protein